MSGLEVKLQKILIKKKIHTKEDLKSWFEKHGTFRNIVGIGPRFEKVLCGLL